MPQPLGEETGHSNPGPQPASTGSCLDPFLPLVEVPSAPFQNEGPDARPVLSLTSVLLPQGLPAVLLHVVLRPLAFEGGDEEC